MINVILSLVVLGLIGLFVYFLFFRKRNVIAPEQAALHQYDLKSMREFVKNAFQDMIHASPYEGNPNAEEFDRKIRRTRKLRAALRTCMYGDLPSKKLVKENIKDLLVGLYGMDEAHINIGIPFDRPNYLSDQERFDILLYLYKKKYKGNAFNQLVKEFNLIELHTFPDGSKNHSILPEKIRDVYDQVKPKLSFKDKVEIVVQRIYQEYKGLGVIDELRDQKIDGISGGTSGLPAEVVESLDAEEFFEDRPPNPKSYDSIWIFYKGKSVYLYFLTFGSQRELIRVCHNIYGYNNPGQLNENKGFILNDMADGSRVVVARPKFADSWVFLVRKFNDSLVEIDKLIQGKNAQFAIETIKFVIGGKQSTAVTGPQGAGKTSLVKSIIGFIQKNLRFQEALFEIWARKLFPYKNVISFRETPSVPGQAGLDFQKKTDGAVNILGEAATHEQVNFAVQIAKTGSEFVLFTHHAKTLPMLIDALSNSLLATGFSTEISAKKEIINSLNFNIHLGFTGEGERFIERITEIIPIYKQREFPREYKDKKTIMEKSDAVADTFVDVFGKMIDADLYEYRDILVYENGEYVAKDRFSEEKIMEMTQNMDKDQGEEFSRYLERYWRNAS